MAFSSSDVTAQMEKYDVFLSFRGEDTRNNYTSFLYGALCRRGIEVFIDNELNRGDEISPSLLKAIEESKISIIVFSKDYASSTWCLEELVKIVECKNSFNQIVIPVFYHVIPSDIKKQTGHFGEAFAKHEARFKDKVPIWKKALTEAANLAGEHFDGTKPEYEFTEKIAEDVLKRLNRLSPGENNGLVGIESRIARIESLLCTGSSKDVRKIVGIWGMGGIGKTTLAYAIFNKIKTQFNSSHFLDVEKEPTFSKDRLPRKKVIIVFDNVTSAQQIEKFTSDPKCFGSGSRVIITARDKQLLLNCGVNDRNIYEVEGLCFDQALQLFSQHAFKRTFPKVDYMELAEKIVEYAKGIPLALKVLGSSLFGKEKEHWKSQINKLEKCPPQDILKVLQPSYDLLDNQQKSIFLDVACFINQANYDAVIDILEACGFSPKSDIPILIDKCLIFSRVSRTNRMHDLLQQMAREITRQEFKDPGQRSRLWHHDDIYHMLTRNTGTEAVEGIRLDMSKIQLIDLNPYAFAMMQYLRIFDFCCSHLPLEFGWLNHYTCNKENYNMVHASQGLKFASEKLAYFRWEGYPLESLPSGFYPNKLVVLVMPHSQVKKLWTSIQLLDNLKHINLSYSKHLTEIPNLSKAPNLESLVLEGYRSLIEISSSIQNLNKLAIMNLRYCKSLRHLPSKICSKALKIVDLSGCSNLSKTPSFPCNMEYLYLSETAISEFPMIEDPSRLVDLTLYKCSRLKSVPSNICELKGLSSLDLTGCSKLENLPSSICELKGLGSLDLTGCSKLENLSSSICELKGLYSLQLSGCSQLESLPSIICELKGCRFLDLTGCSKLESLPSNICELKDLDSLFLNGCSKLQSLPSSICNLKDLHLLYLTGCSKLDRLPDELGDLEHLQYLKVDETAIREVPISITRLNKLHRLSFTYCGLTELPDNFDQLTLLRELCLDGNNFEKIPAIIKNLPQLSFLGLSSCKRLQSLQELQGGGQLVINLDGCVALVDLSDLSWSWMYKINFANCIKLDKDAIGNKMKDDLLKYQQGFHRICNGDICFPGNEIPEWFGFQTTGSSMKIKLPPNWYNENFCGFAICAVVGFPDHNTKSIHFGASCSFCTKSKYGNGIEYHHFDFGPRSTEFYYEDHVFLALHIREFGSPFFHNQQQIDECVDLIEDNEVYIKFGVFKQFYEDNDEWICKVKKCGIHLIYGPDSGKPMEEPSKSFNSSRSFNNDEEEEKEEPYSKRLKVSNYKNKSFRKNPVNVSSLGKRKRKGKGKRKRIYPFKKLKILRYL